MLELRQALSMVLEQNAIQLPLQDRKYGVRVSPITDRNLLTTANFVLAVNADMPAETLRNRFPAQVKIGPVEQIRNLVNLQLPGIGLRPLPVAPRQIPYHTGVTYFELDRNSEYWKQLHNSGGFAFHVAGQFPGIQLAFWAIKG
jgi:type VI secretion system protein ImpJ